MKVDFRLLRRAFLGICGLASLSSLLVVGCVSGPKFHSARFWDKDDVKASSNDDKKDDKKPDAKKSKASKDADDDANPPKDDNANPSKKVSAASRKKTDDVPGHASFVDFRDPAPPAAVRPIAPASVWKDVDFKGNDFVTSDLRKGAAVSQAGDAVRPASVAKVDSIRGKEKEADPFSDDAASSLKSAPTTKPPSGALAGAKSRRTDDFADLMDAQLADVHKKIARDEAPQTSKRANQAVHPVAATSIDGPTIVSNRAATPDAVASAEPRPQMPDLVQSNDSGATSAFAVAGSKGISRDMIEFGRTIADRSNKTVATADYSDELPPPSPEPAASPPRKTLPSAEAHAFVPIPSQQGAAAADVWESTAENPRTVAAPSHRESAVFSDEMPAMARRPNSIPTPKTQLPIEPAAAKISDSTGPLICDSTSVRGRFTGADLSSGPGVARLSGKEQPKTAVAVSWNDSDPFGEPAPIANSPAKALARREKATGRQQTASAVKNAAATGWDEDPFATVPAAHGIPESSGNEPTHSGSSTESPAPPAPAELHDGASTGTAAASAPAIESRMKSEGWFAIGIGIGLAASGGLWMRSRQKIEAAAN